VIFAAITLYVASQRGFIVVVVLLHYRLSPETFGYTIYTHTPCVCVCVYIHTYIHTYTNIFMSSFKSFRV